MSIEKTEQEASDSWANQIGVNSEMVCRVVGDTPIWMGADPVGGWVYFGEMVRTVDGLYYVQTYARWSCVQGENVKIVHERAMNVIESGLGSMR